MSRDIRMLVLGDKLGTPPPLPDILKDISGKSVLDVDLYHALKQYEKDCCGGWRAEWIQAEADGLKLIKVSGSVNRYEELFIACDITPNEYELERLFRDEYGGDHDDWSIDDIEFFRYPQYSTDTEKDLKIREVKPDETS
jgi:hypothetical protein